MKEAAFFAIPGDSVAREEPGGSKFLNPKPLSKADSCEAGSFSTGTLFPSFLANQM